MRLDAATLPLPIERERGIALLWSVTDLIQPALDLVERPGTYTPRQLATTIFNGSGNRVAAVRDAIAAVEALDTGYMRPADAARAGLDAWVAALPFIDDETPLQGGSPLSPASDWLNAQINEGLRAVTALASLAAPSAP